MKQRTEPVNHHPSKLDQHDGPEVDQKQESDGIKFDVSIFCSAGPVNTQLQYKLLAHLIRMKTTVIVANTITNHFNYILMVRMCLMMGQMVIFIICTQLV